MKHTNEQLTAKLLQVLELSGYYEARWQNDGSRESREKKAYYKGQADMIVELYGYLLSSEETRKAIETSKLRYKNEDYED